MEWMASSEKAAATLNGGELAEVVLVGSKGMGGESVVLDNIVYWGADDHEGMVMAPSEVEAWRGEDAFEFRGSNGFMITVSVASDSEHATAAAAGASR